eukprot:365516_1
MLDTDQDIKEVVDSLGIKKVIIKKKLIKAIKGIQNTMEVKQDNDDNDEKKSMQRKTIRWEDVDSKMVNIQRIQIQSNKHKTVQIDKTNSTSKHMLSEKRVNMSYFSLVTRSWKQGISGKISASILAPAVVLETVIPILPVIYVYDKNQENSRVIHTKERNAQSKIFNNKLSQIKQCEEWIFPKIKELQKQEQTLNNQFFELERFCDLGDKSRVVMMIGPTGFGKSLISNRLLGNNNDIDHISESKECDFPVAKIGNADSVTDKLTKKSKIIHINEEESFVLSVVDTPGAFDSKGNDNDHNNMMAHYFEACGGINVFGIVFQFGGKTDINYNQLIQKYVDFFGERLWKHCCIFITYCDMDSKKGIKRIKKGLQKTKDQINLFLKEISNNKNINIPIYMFGEDNFKKSTNDLLLSLTDQNCPFYNKYKCENIESPIDFLYKQLQMDVEQHNMLLKQMEIMSKQLEKTGDGIWRPRARNHIPDGDCPLQHGLQKYTRGWMSDPIWCDECSKSIERKIEFYVCWKCKYALCPNCHVK